MNTVTKAFLIRGLAGAALAGAALAPAAALAAPVVSRLTPPSLKFSYGDDGAPYISRFFIDQRFDLQATVSPDAGRTITGAKFLVDDVEVPGTVTFIPCNAPGLPADTVAPTLRAYSNTTPGVHTLKVVATQDDDTTVEAEGNFEVVGFTVNGRQAKNVIFMIGDGMGIAHRSAARIMYRGIVSGKSLAPLEMDDMPATALVKTASLNSIITDSAPGAACYSSGNKGNNNQQGVFPDDTTDAFDNPRIELIGEYLARTQQKSLGIVTTADVFDATPGAFGSHTQDRGAGTGICDGYLDEQAVNANLKVLLGGGRKWFLPAGETGSARSGPTGSTISAELAAAWNLTPGTSDPARDLLSDFEDAGFVYTPDRTTLAAIPADTTKLLGLFAFSNMNVAKDKLDGRRGITPAGATQSVVADYGFTDQPLLEEMTDAALRVLNKNRKGFVLMVEGASIDKQAHNMDTERWITDTIEFDKAIGVAKQFAAANPDTLIIVTADHECAGVNIIGASRVTDANLKALASAGGGAATLRDQVVGTYEVAGFPIYTLADDGYPQTTDIDYRMLVGYAANCDRYEDWLTNPRPLRDSQQPLNGEPPLNTYPGAPVNRDQAGDFFVTGQVPGSQAVHTGSDIPLTATGRASSLFRGVVDNTDVFFLAMQAIHGGASY
ncbi:alkaline phosphatase [Opitutaceae bacterium TAV5]|nr:alkaline phosphatase [Opitutaceae bacterium TAV5]